ncbi:putative lipase (plasmid) [Burkholderia sp. YI23]|uniref:lipase family protein n=1 Tax=unclassified Caballeronia TaxID=2646786 RepID=UPI0002388B71|nr:MULTISPECIES: lipase family protein [unclassified Caballeronia]AET95074.1 putative lipase [Burkholderia sp. YI23]MCE4547606.1 lipase family protein [Caballeronia sp. PC1]MCE4575064.1 lipase family protein [Caballeronia sp. CLC5]
MSPRIQYDPSRLALYSPEARPTCFEPARDYSLLQIAVEAARLAYIRAETDEWARLELTNAFGSIGFSAPATFADEKTGSAGFAAYRATDGMAIVAFRGTQPDEVSDLATDLHANRLPWKPGMGKVHAGFAKAASSLETAVRAWLAEEGAARQRLVLTGHSLGAAIATLLATVFQPTELITLGSPRVGDAAFAACFGGLEVTRLVDCCDVVTELPPEGAAYTHIVDMTYITRSGAIDPVIDPAGVASDRASARSEYFFNYAWKIGNVLLRDLADHAPINYVRGVFA